MAALGGFGKAAGAPVSFSIPLLSWHRADTGVTLNGSNVSAWAPLAGLAGATAIATAPGGNQPTQPAVNAKLNNKLSIGFTLSQWLVTGTYSTAPGATLTIILVFSDGAPNKFLFDSLAGDSQPCRAVVNNVAGFVLGGTTVLNGSAYDLAGHCFVGLLNGASSSERKDNMTTTDAAGTASFAATGFTIGDDRALGANAGGNLSEFLVLNGDLSTADKAAYRTYAQAQWGLTIGV
jgi:hypothetical protein